MTGESAPIGIIGAMDSEIGLLLAAMEDARAVSAAGSDFVQGSIDGAACAVVRCGVGMVNAAACAQALIDRFAPRCIVNTGVAGSLDAAVGIGDVVAATAAVNWMMDVQNLGYAPGQTPGAPSALIALDENLRAAALAAAEAEGKAVCEGIVASGDRFVRDAVEKRFIAETFGAVCCEMEGAAIAQTCQRNGVPCAILRVISDTADGSDAIDYPTFEVAAAASSAAIARRFAAALR